MLFLAPAAAMGVHGPEPMAATFIGPKTSPVRRASESHLCWAMSMASNLRSSDRNAVFGQFNGSALQVSAVAAELLFKSVEQSKRIGGRTGKAVRIFPVLEFAYFLTLLLAIVLPIVACPSPPIAIGPL